MLKKILYLFFITVIIGASFCFFLLPRLKKPKQSFKNMVIMFDFDGTLVDGADRFIATVNQTLQEYSYPAGITYDELRTTPAVEILKKHNVSFWRLPFLKNRALEIMSQHLTSLSPFPGTRQMLLALKEQGFHLGILTSNSQKNVEGFLQHHNLQIFDVVYSGASMFGKAKVLKRFLNDYNVPKEQIMYIGDETRDIEAAHEVGVPIIAVSWGYNCKELLTTEKPNFLVDTQDQVATAIAKIINNKK